MKNSLVNVPRKWALMFCVLFPLCCRAEQFVELTAEIDFDGWDGWFFKDRINNDPVKSPLRLGSIFTTNWPMRCVVGTNTWMMEFTSENAMTTYWFSGTTLIVTMGGGFCGGKDFQGQMFWWWAAGVL